MWLMNLPMRPWILFMLMVLLAWAGPGKAWAVESAGDRKTCAFDPASGKTNPLGMRAFITIRANGEVVHVVFEQFPTPVGREVTVGSKRELVFYGRSLAAARSELRASRSLYKELVGYDDPAGFKPVDAVLVCR